MTQQFENFVNAALDKSLSSDVTLPTADDIPVFTGIGRQVTGKTIAELGLKPKVLGYGTSPETLEVGYEYINTNGTNISSVVYEMPDPEFVPDGSRIVIHNLKFGGTTLLGTSNWTQGGPSRFMEFPNYSPATTSPIPEYSRGVITTLTSIKAYKVWLKESHRPSKMLPTGDSMRFYREDDITATITNYLGNIPAETNRVITYPDSDVDLGKLTNSTVAPSNITVTASPFTYQNTTAFNGDVIISGGTVSDIEFTRDNTTFYTVGFIEGVLRLSPSDRVRVTYTVAPTMTLVPR